MPGPQGKEGDPPNEGRRRSVSRRDLFRGRLPQREGGGPAKAPAWGKAFRTLLQESPEARRTRLVAELWRVFTRSKPSPEQQSESAALLAKAGGPDEEADALVDIAWALSQTQEFAAAPPPDAELVERLYRFALERPATPQERDRAVPLFKEAGSAGEKTAVIEGLLSALLRMPESITRRR